jgi:hypothetical protein
MSDAEKGTTFKLSATAAVAALAAEPAATATHAAAKHNAAPSSSSSSRSLPEQLGLRLRNVLLGFQMILRSKYLLMLCGNLLLTYVSGSGHFFHSSRCFCVAFGVVAVLAACIVADTSTVCAEAVAGP